MVSLWELLLIGARRFAPRPEAGADRGVFAAIRAGLSYMWSDPTLRMLFTIIVAVNFLVVGPLLVGIPVIAAQRLSQGAEGYGIVMSAFGGSSLVGIAVAGLLPRPPARLVGSLLLCVCAVFSVAMGLVGYGALSRRRWRRRWLRWAPPAATSSSSSSPGCRAARRQR